VGEVGATEGVTERRPLNVDARVLAQTRFPVLLLSVGTLTGVVTTLRAATRSMKAEPVDVDRLGRIGRSKVSAAGLGGLLLPMIRDALRICFRAPPKVLWCESVVPVILGAGLGRELSGVRESDLTRPRQDP